MDAAFLQERITAVKAEIVALETAFLNLSSGAILSYTIDTGQSRQVVTKASIGTINTVLNSLYNLLATLEARLNGGGTVTVRPAW